MNLKDQIYYSCAAYSSIHPNKGAVLNHLFCVIGNGYEWHNGELIALDGDMYTKDGRPLSVESAINKTFRNRRKNDAARKAWERKRKREEKLTLQHKKDCPITTRCNCGMWHVDDNDHNKWCGRNFPQDLKCDCGTAARIAENDKFMASIDATIEKVVAEMAKRTSEEKAADMKRADAALKHTKRQMREAKSNAYRIPTDIDERVKDTKYDHWYPMCSYSKMVCFPDNIKPMWLNAIIETAQLVIANPPQVDQHNPQARADETVALAKQSLERALALKAARTNALKVARANAAA
jgi:hypothetical protein